MAAISLPFNEMQLEIIQLFAREMSADDMKAIKRMITRYFAQKAIESADQVWEEKGWTQADEARLLAIHQRTPSQKKLLCAAFAKMEDLNMFSKIDDPKKWQKQQRDEWE
jgi:hypothetical protein